LDVVDRPSSKKGLARVVDAVRSSVAGRVVVGLPLSLSGGDSAQTAEARSFAALLAERLDVPVELYDERFTTSIARARGGTASEDSRAAAALLEGWLARHAGAASA
jgi:putative Holliday junction resolvase